MEGSSNSETSVKKAKKRSKVSMKQAGIIVIAAVVLFGSGWLAGGGRIRVRSNNQNTTLPATLDFSSTNAVYRSLKENFDGKLDEQKLQDGASSGLVKAAGDPYTEFFNAKDAQDFKNQLDGTFEGIGAELGKNENDNIIVVSPIAGFPAAKAGIMSKDIIAKIDGNSTEGMTIDQAVTKIRGKAGTSVKLTIVRDGALQDITITRQQISIPSVKLEVKDGIGIITISRFGDDTAELAMKAANDFKSQNVKGVVLDLRGNPGGLLTSAVSVSSLWLQDKTVLTERRNGQVIQTYPSAGESPLNGIPTVVLIDGGSASASEITAGALRDNKAATLMGLKSFGKGSVQQPINFKDGSMLKVTIARWYTPAGKNIDKEGIKPDTEVKVTAEQVKAGQDPQMDAAVLKLSN